MSDMKPWNLSRADREFSKMILGYPFPKMCARCKRSTATDCSHYFKRSNSGVRYNVHNADELCRPCHDFFHEDRKAYDKWKLERIGARALVDLQRLSVMVVPLETAIIRFMKTQGEKN